MLHHRTQCSSNEEEPQLWIHSSNMTMNVCWILGLVVTFTGARQLVDAGKYGVHREDSGKEEPDMVIEAEELKVATGSDVQFQCITSQPIIWLDPNGTDINLLNSTRLTYNATTGELHILQVQMVDSGNYTCTVENWQLWESVLLEVYVMPDYFLEGIIILSINAGLIVLFIGCCVYSYVRDRRIQKAAEKQGFLSPKEAKGPFSQGITAGL